VRDAWHLDALRGGAAWDRGLSGCGVLVGVLDSGIDAAHPEFRDASIHFAQFDRSGRRDAGAPVADLGVHGTHVCGLIAGRTCGLAPGADLAVAAVLTMVAGQVGTITQMAAGLAWLLTTPFRAGRMPGVDVINASIAVDPNDPEWSAALALARSRGVLVIGPAGEAPGLFGVGALDWHNGQSLGCDASSQVFAPGVGVWSSLPGRGYGSGSGRSIAAALVSGVAALLIEAHPSLIGDADGLASALRHCPYFSKNR
jgi:serine protease AprX